MKKFTRHLLSFVTVLALLLSLSTLLSGCYVVRSGKMKQIEGTYELTSYSGLTDYIAEKERTLFMVIKADGTGYYAYKDNSTAPHIAEIRCRFIADEESSGKYAYVEVNFIGGTDYEKLAVSASGEYTNLNSRTLRWKNTSKLSEGTYTVNVGFTRVDDATDLSYVNEHFGEYDPLPHGSLRFAHSYELQQIEDQRDTGEALESPYVYSFMKVDLVARKLKAWYMLKSDEIAHADEYDIEMVRDGFGDYFFRANGTDIIPDLSLAPYGYYLKIKLQEGVFMKFSITGDLTDEYAAHLIDTKYGAFLSQKTHDLIEDGIRGLMRFQCNVYHGEGVECDCDPIPNVADPSKYSSEKFEQIDSLIAEYFIRFRASESYINCDLLALYKKARLYYLYEEALANVNAAYETSAHPMKDALRDGCINQINSGMNKTYTLSATVECIAEHGEGVECDCTNYVIVEDVATAALKVFTKEYCENAFKYEE